MSAVNLFILDELSRGNAHGHQLLLKAEHEHVSIWTDIQVSGLYSALKRLVGQGLIRAAKTETASNYPERTVYAITKEGRQAQMDLLRNDLRKVIFRMDPFDLALQRAVDLSQKEIKSTLLERRDEFLKRASELSKQIMDVDARLNSIERRIAEHLIGRLKYEATWHTVMLQSITELIDDQKITRGANDDHNRFKTK